MSLFDAAGKTQKEQYLDILALVYYVLAGLGVLITGFVFAMVFFAMLIPMLASPADAGPPLAIAGIIMGCVGFFALAFSLASCAIQVAAGWCLQQRKGYVWILIVAAFMLLSIPLGTMLGIFTIVLLSDAEVRALFGIAPASPAPDQPVA